MFHVDVTVRVSLDQFWGFQGFSFHKFLEIETSIQYEGRAKIRDSLDQIAKSYCTAYRKCGYFHFENCF
jgi:hypothetical protein